MPFFRSSHRPAARLPSRRFLLLVAVIAAATLLRAACQGNVVEVGILESRQGDDVDAARTAVVQALRDAGYKAGDNIRFFRLNAESQDRSLGELARHLIEKEEVDLVLALTVDALAAANTWSLTKTQATGRSVPVVFALVAVPPFSPAEERSIQGRVTGAAGFPPPAEVIDIVRRLVPGAARLGVLEGAGFPPSKIVADAAADAARRTGLEVMIESADPQVSTAIQRLLERGAQALLLAPDPALEQRFDDILRAANAAGVPVFAWNEDLTERGALASVGIDYADHGRRAGEIIVRVLRGEPISNIPVSTEVRTQLWLNASVAQRLGIAIPPELRAQAARVIDR